MLSPGSQLDLLDEVQGIATAHEAASLRKMLAKRFTQAPSKQRNDDKAPSKALPEVHLKATAPQDPPPSPQVEAEASDDDMLTSSDEDEEEIIPVLLSEDEKRFFLDDFPPASSSSSSSFSSLSSSSFTPGLAAKTRLDTATKQLFASFPTIPNLSWENALVWNRSKLRLMCFRQNDVKDDHNNEICQALEDDDDATTDGEETCSPSLL